MTATPTYTRVLSWLEDQLRAGALSLGDKLPSERALAEQFDMSRASVREAIRVLDVMGLVRSAPGSGPASGAVIVSEPSAALGWAVRMHIATSSLPVADVVETRILLETQAAAASGAGRVTAKERARILSEARRILTRMDDASLPRDEFHHLDTRFHELLTGLGGNIVVETLMRSLREATLGYVQETVSELPSWPQTRSTLQEQHHAILASAEAGDGPQTAQLIDAHIRWFAKLAQ